MSSSSPKRKLTGVGIQSKIFLQFSIFSVVAAMTWNYFDNKSKDSANLKISFPELSEAELLAVAESLYMPPPKHIIDAKTLPLIQLGHELFFDTKFSSDDSIACASCHEPEKSFTDGKAKSQGLRETSMNAPTLANVARGHWFFWNGRADSLESQAAGPVEHPGEHGFSRVRISHRLKTTYQKKYESIFGPLPQRLPVETAKTPQKSTPLVSDEVAAFALSTLGDSSFQKSVLAMAASQGVQPIAIVKNFAAYGAPERAQATSSHDPIQMSQKEQEEVDEVFMNFARAIAAFEKTIQASNSSFDKFVERFSKTKKLQESLDKTFGPSELNGLRIFAGKGQCLVCHNGPNFTDEQFHNIGLPAIDTNTLDLGRAQGLLIARSDPFNCQSKFFPEKKQTESCLEIGYLESENVDSVGAYKTPTLRQLKHTAPFGHDGRFETLADVIRHYNDLSARPAVGRAESTLRPLGLSEQELKHLEAFLLSLHGSITHFTPSKTKRLGS